MKRTERDAARALRKEGYSINEIVKKISVSKASVSVWVRDIVLTKEQKAHMSVKGRSVESIERRRLSRISNTHARHQIEIDKAKSEIAALSRQELLLVGAALYWGEGNKTSKGTAGVANSDPTVIRMMMRFFREICMVPEGKIRGHIHTFSHLNSKVAEKYWSEVSGIPLTQFYKTYSKPSIASSSKKDSLPYGTLQVYVNDVTVFLRIKGMIERLGELGSTPNGNCKS